MRIIQLYHFLVLLFISGALNAQFVFPKLPAESKEFKVEEDAIVEAGYTKRLDIRYIVFDGKVSTEKYTEKIIEYTESGKINEQEIKDKAGRTRLIVIYHYDDRGLPKRITKFQPTGDIIGRFELKYDRYGFLLEKTEYDQYDYVVKRIVYRKNAAEKTITELQYSSPEMITKKYVYRYTDFENGKLKSVSEFEGESVLILKKEYFYTYEKLNKIHFSNRYGAVIYFHEYSYDRNGYVSDIKKHIPGGDVYPFKNEQHTSNGLLTGEVQYEKKGGIKTYYKFSFH